MSANRIILTEQFSTPLGTMIAAAVEEGVCLCEFSNRRILEREFTTLEKLLRATRTEGSHRHIEHLKLELHEYFHHQRQTFTVPLVTPGTSFQQQVWKELLNIPYGTTRSYKQQAIALGNLAAIRAVAHANGMNRIAILIPCHRVIGDDGSLIGYGGGIERKRWLLQHEQAKSDGSKQENLFAGSD